MIRKFIRYYQPHKTLFFLDMLCAFLVAACDLFYPSIARNIINVYIPNKSIRLLFIWGGVLLCIYLVKAGLNYFMEYYGHVVGVRMQADMRRDVFRKLQRLPFSYFDEHKTGVIMSRIINDLMDISELAHHGPEDLFLSVVMLIGSFFILARIDLALTLIVFAAVPFVTLFAVKMRRRMSHAFTRSREEIAEVNAALENAIAGIRVSRAYTTARHESEKFDRQNKRFVASRSLAYRVMAQFHTGMTFSMDLLYLLVLVAGGLFYFYNQINIGDFVAYLLYVNLFLEPIKRFVSFFEQLQNGMTGFERFEDIMNRACETEKPDAIRVDTLNGDIRFERVSFSYSKDDGALYENSVIRDLSLDVPCGKTVALVGPSGGGKTTLCNLIPRFYEITGGRITIAGYDIRDLSRDALRKNIGIVAQDVFLFTGTIRENIAYGNLDATDAEIIDAAKKANLDDFVSGLPDGYETYVGERGVKLSGGQKQRISIARAFLKNPPILILDEATSALDNRSERLVQSALESLSAGRTTIVVAHRLSTVRGADKIVVLTDDGIREQGTHDELLAQNGVYASLYRAGA